MTQRIANIFAAFLGGMLLIATVAIAQQPQPRQGPPQPGGPPDMRPHNMPNPPNPDPLGDVMFPPDFILGHARQLGLTDEQKSYMRGEVQKTMASFTELQWKLQDETETLHETLKNTSVNEQQALAQLNKVLDIEREIKRLHIGLGVRLKNRLTPEQQSQLQKMRMRPMAPSPDAAPRPPEQ
jgi:Spy/CpxP family protein refolding chaperone